MKQLVKGDRIDPQHCLIPCDQPLLGHVHRHPQRGRAGPLTIAGLQHIELVLLDGELDVLHVAIMGLELRAHSIQLTEHLWHRLFHRQLGLASGLAGGLGQRQRRADAGDDVLALGVDQIFPVKAVLAGRRVTCEGNAGGTVVAHIAKDHGLHIHRRPPGGRNVVQPAIGGGAGIHPAVEDGPNGPP